MAPWETLSVTKREVLQQPTISNESCCLASRIRGVLNKAMVIDDVSDIEGMVRSRVKVYDNLTKRKRFIWPTMTHVNTFLQNFSQRFPGRLILLV